ncbi:MAG: hypothetical protein MRERV_36c034 [Mycoplasmataceae bacterium RV_VA103A]|jgi:hypothetical protein|nr:MAG: hypothetical protein MRERV_36c034 [Mycoplasmataceae bacterium RV_VA103A]
MAKEIQENQTKSRRIESIDTAQLEYTATTMFTYGTICVAVIGIYAATIYLFVQQLKK